MVADALEIFGDHNDVHRFLSLACFVRDGSDDVAAHVPEQRVHDVVVAAHLARELQIAAHEGVDAFVTILAVARDMSIRRRARYMRA